MLRQVHQGHHDGGVQAGDVAEGAGGGGAEAPAHVVGVHVVAEGVGFLVVGRGELPEVAVRDVDQHAAAALLGVDVFMSMWQRLCSVSICLFEDLIFILMYCVGTCVDVGQHAAAALVVFGSTE